MASQSHQSNIPAPDVVLSLTSEQLYDLVSSSDPAAIEELIARLFREFFLEDPARCETLLDHLSEITSDPVLRSLACAPDDDEPLTDEDLEAIDESLAEFERGDVVAHEQLTR